MGREMNIIEFPGLGLSFSIDPIALHLPIFSGGIRWYALIIVTGIVLAAIVCFREYKRIGGKEDDLYNLIIYSIPVSIICARLYYVAFSPYPLQSFWDIFKIWEGGIAIYGAVIGAVLVIVLYCRKKGLSILRHFDIAAYGFLIGQIIGRWGNFVNGEAYGAPTDLPWRMVVNGVAAHPTFLYESLWNLAAFTLIRLTGKRNAFEGRVSAMYLIFYGIGRLWIEMLRTDSLMLGSVRVSAMLSGIMVVSGIALYAVLRRKKAMLKSRDNITQTIDE